MTAAFQLSALALCAAALALVLRQQRPELAMVLSLCACALGAAMLLSYLTPLLELGARLARRAELKEDLTAPLWKCLGLGLLTEISASVCADAGQAALAKLVELGGCILCLAVSLPLLQAVLALIEGLL